MIIPSPGIILCELVEDRGQLGLSLTALKTGSRLVQGKVLAVGSIEHTKFNSDVNPAAYAAVDNIIVFLSYADGYDHITIDGKRYYFIKIEDVRGVVN